MATETVTQCPKAMACWDSSVFLTWIEAMADMLMTGGDPSQMDKHTLQNYGGLMHALTQAADELQEGERNELKAAKQ